ncbi:MAG TPA: hypothetical protein VEJ18_07340, partial [Planctomycetota bacterium]|nr:hypothetical protein [Planctomycetota bacterium]
MRLWAAALLTVCLQDDPFKVLADPALRGREVARKAAADACRAKALESPRHWAAAELLSQADWKLAAPAAADLDALLAKHWAAPTADEAAHKASLAALVAAVDKHARNDPASPFHALAMAEVAVLGDRAA